MIVVHAAGRYAHRQPLAYGPVRQACAGRIAVVADAAKADILIAAHWRDLPELAGRAAPGQRLVLLSEEPLWDTVWSPDPLARAQEVAGRPVTVLNHHTSAIFAFDRIPAFLLTDRAYVTRYARWFARNAALGPGDWAERWAAANRQAAFVAEYRDGAEFDVDFPEAGILGLGRWRTQVALACPEDRVLRAGAGWNALPRRQDLPDWHLEKHLDLRGRFRVISAIENTHQRHYVSEKLFDAYACGAVPAYVAGPGHRAFDIAPEPSWLNLHGLEPEAAAAAIMGFAPGAEFCAAYAATQARLAALFSDFGALAAERARLAGALEAELRAVLETSEFTGEPGTGLSQRDRQDESEADAD